MLTVQPALASKESRAPRPGQLPEIVGPGIHQIESEESALLRTRPSGVVTLDDTGNAIVSIANLAFNAHVLLTVQSGVTPTGSVYVSALVPDASFTISSTAGGDDEGVIVYYRVYTP